MTKRYDESIDVTPDPIDTDAPLSFQWRGRRYQIDQRLESWREGGEWWRSAGANSSGRARPDAEANSSGRARPDAEANSKQPKEREFHRVLARPYGASASGELDPDGFLVRDRYQAVYDLYRDRINDVWKLARVWD